MKSNFMELGKLIKEVRLEARLTQIQLAKKVGLSPSSLNNFEKGIRRLSLEQSFRIEHQLGLKSAPLSDWIIAQDYAAATDGQGLGVLPFKESLHKHRGDSKPGHSAVETQYQLELEGKVDGQVVRVPVKLPKNIYLKLEFQ